MKQTIDIQDVINISEEAGRQILNVYIQDFDVIEKEDSSPLTLADQRSNDVIINRLKELYPDIPIISEETREVPYSERKSWSLFWLVDPLDGTKEFIKKNGEFTVNIALIEHGHPIMGVVHVPVQNKTYYAEQGKGAYVQNESGESVQILNPVSYLEKDVIKVVASRSHLSEEVVQFVEDLKKQGKEVEFLSAGSSLKFCLVAEGSADVYPRLAPTMEWDTGAAHAVCIEAGKQVFRYEDETPLIYNKEELRNPWFIVQ